MHACKRGDGTRMQEEDEEESLDDQNLAWKLAPDHVQPQDALPATIGTQQRSSAAAAGRSAPTNSSGPGLFAPASGAVLWAAGKNSTRAAGNVGRQSPSGRGHEATARGGSGSEAQVLQHEREEIRALKKELAAAKAKVCRVMPLAPHTRPPLAHPSRAATHAERHTGGWTRRRRARKRGAPYKRDTNAGGTTACTPANGGWYRRRAGGRRRTWARCPSAR